MDFVKSNTDFEPLGVSAKNCFPFALACPSFVYRAGYQDNVRLLAPCVDEIELLFLESSFADSLPSPDLIQDLTHLARSGQITYNVHLPMDIDLGHQNSQIRQSAVDILNQVIACCAPLAPTTFTLHLNFHPAEADIPAWRKRTLDSIEAILGTGLPGRRISVECLDYDFTLAAPIVEQLDLSVCLDMGHLMAKGRDPVAFFDQWRERITTIHLHGVDGAMDHLPLDRLSPELMTRVMAVLPRFSGVVSLEVFSVAALQTSLLHLLTVWSGV